MMRPKMMDGGGGAQPSGHWNTPSDIELARVTMSEPTLWRRCDEKEHTAVLWPRKGSVVWVKPVAAGALLIEQPDAAVLVGADAICPIRHRLNEQPCETCKERVRMVFAACVGGTR